MTNARVFTKNSTNDDELDQRIDFYGEIQENLGLQTIWSIFTVDDFRKVPFPEAEVITYKGGWGRSGSIWLETWATWEDLWIAADKLIVQSGDLHHIFIERISRSKDDPTELVIETGS
jgi:hypothetical protein